MFVQVSRICVYIWIHTAVYISNMHILYCCMCALQLQTQVMFNYECSECRCLKPHLVSVDAVVAALAILLSIAIASVLEVSLIKC